MLRAGTALQVEKRREARWAIG